MLQTLIALKQHAILKMFCSILNLQEINLLFVVKSLFSNYSITSIENIILYQQKFNFKCTYYMEISLDFS